MACIPEETKIFESTLHKTASNGKTEKCKERIFILAHKIKGPGIKGTRKTLGDVKNAEYILFYRNIGEENPIRVLYLNEKANFIAESETKIIKGQKMYAMQLTLSTDTKSRTFFLYTPSKTINDHWCYHLKTAVQRETPIEQYRHESIVPRVLQESERIYSKPCVRDSGYNSKENLYEDMNGYKEEFRQREVRSYTGPVLSTTKKVSDVKRSLTDSQKNRPSEAGRPTEALIT